MKHTTIEIEYQYNVSTIWLNRPEQRNSFNEQMISELTDAIKEEGTRDDVRAIVLRGKGKVFCAGADLNWMQSASTFEYDQNYKESLLLAECFHALYVCPKPTLAIVHGAAMGGGNGLLAACDFAFCEAETIFSLSEVKLGLIPATISPYIIRRVGEYNAKDLMLTGRRFTGIEAEQLKLINKCFNDIHATEAHLQSVIQLLITSGPNAINQCKKLINHISNETLSTDTLAYTATMIATMRASKEAQEGMSAFLEKRKPNWLV